MAEIAAMADLRFHSGNIRAAQCEFVQNVINIVTPLLRDAEAKKQRLLTRHTTPHVVAADVAADMLHPALANAFKYLAGNPQQPLPQQPLPLLAEGQQQQFAEGQQQQFAEGQQQQFAEGQPQPQQLAEESVQPQRPLQLQLRELQRIVEGPQAQPHHQQLVEELQLSRQPQLGQFADDLQHQQELGLTLGFQGRTLPPRQQVMQQIVEAQRQFAAEFRQELQPLPQPQPQPLLQMLQHITHGLQQLAKDQQLRLQAQLTAGHLQLVPPQILPRITAELQVFAEELQHQYQFQGQFLFQLKDQHQFQLEIQQFQSQFTTEFQQLAENQPQVLFNRVTLYPQLRLRLQYQQQQVESQLQLQFDLQQQVTEDQLQQLVKEEPLPLLLAEDQQQIAEEPVQQPQVAEEPVQQLAEDQTQLAEDQTQLAEDQPQIAEDQPQIAEDQPQIAEEPVQQLAEDQPQLAEEQEWGVESILQFKVHKKQQQVEYLVQWERAVNARGQMRRSRPSWSLYAHVQKAALCIAEYHARRGVVEWKMEGETVYFRNQRNEWTAIRNNPSANAALAEYHALQFIKVAQVSDDDASETEMFEADDSDNEDFVPPAAKKAKKQQAKK